MKKQFTPHRATERPASPRAKESRSRRAGSSNLAQIEISSMGSDGPTNGPTKPPLFDSALDFVDGLET